MPLSYKAPLRDIRFLTNEVFNYTEHYKTLKCGQNADPETVDMMLDSIADYCSNVLMPCISQVMPKAVILIMAQ